MEFGIKLRPVKPSVPHLNVNVERTQRTDLIELYSTTDINNLNLFVDFFTFNYQIRADKNHLWISL